MTAGISDQENNLLGYLAKQAIPYERFEHAPMILEVP